MNREFLIVFMYPGPNGESNYNNCWMNLVGKLTKEVIKNAAAEVGLNPDKVTILCIQELEI